MSFRKTISRRFLFSGIFLGLNLLCFMGVIHGRHVMRHARVNYSHIPPRGMVRVGSRNERSSSMNSAATLIEHAPQTPDGRGSSTGPHHVTPIAMITAAAALLRPTFLAELIAGENVVALGSAPRAPGLGRGPPVV
jgi:hypothetical protein